MLSMKAEAVVNALVKQLLVEDTDPDETRALHFHIDARMSYHGHAEDGESFNASRGLHLLYHSEFRYVTVFSSIVDSPFDRLSQVESWKHESSHDSCWRNIEAFAKVYFGMAKEINAALVQKGYPEVAPCEMHEHNSFAIFGAGVFDWVPVRVTKDPEDRHRYRRIVEVI